MTMRTHFADALQNLGRGRWATRLQRVSEGRPKAILASVLLVSALAWGAAGALAWMVWDVQRVLPGMDELQTVGEMAQTTVIYDMEGEPAFAIFRERRMDVPIESVSPHITRAIIAIEDQRFYKHAGIDLVRIAGAALHNLRTGGRTQGGSTITQQLARQSFLTLERTLRRKVNEVLLALALERSFSKEEILELYLNKVYFGDGYYGVEAAARGFFGKPATEVTIAEAALLAGLVKSPSTYAPTVGLEQAVERRNVVLRAMRATRAIDQAEYDEARQAPVRLQNGLHVEEGFGQYFKRQVQRELVQRFGWERVSEGGLRVYTTLDPALQRHAEELVEQELARIERRPGYGHTPRAAMETTDGQAPAYLQGAVVAIDPPTGAVRAMVGGRQYQESGFNRAVQARRQPASAFKPFVYAAAIEEGYSPAMLLTDLDHPVLTPEGDWVPMDGQDSESTQMTMRSALRLSSNRAAVRMLRTVGLDTAMTHLSHLGFGTLPAVPSIVLGSGEVTLEALTSAYAAFANGGQLYEPTLIRRVEDREGAVLYEAAPRSARVFSEDTTFIVANMLQDAINRGTAWRARESGFQLPAAGKTGTSNDYKDAWFVGFTPHVAMGVWVGFDRPQRIMTNGYASDVAAPLWGKIMSEATRGHEAEWLERPAGVTGVEICQVSGKRPAAGCGSTEVVSAEGEVTVRSMVYTEYFRKGSVPTEICDLHPRPSFLHRVAGWFGAGDSRAPTGGVELPSGVALPPPSSPDAPEEGTAPTAARPFPQPTEEADSDPVDDEEEARAEEEPRKRGFWSRLFGRRDRSDDESQKSEPEASEPRKRPRRPNDDPR